MFCDSLLHNNTTPVVMKHPLIKVYFIHVAVYNISYFVTLGLPKMQQESLTVYFKSVIKKMFIVLVYVIKGNL